jgi:hypothetical protein
MKLDLLTNATVVDDAIRFVCSSSKQKVQEEKAKAIDLVIEDQDNNSSHSSNISKNNDIQGSEEEKQQQQCGTIAADAATTNHTF